MFLEVLVEDQVAGEVIIHCYHRKLGGNQERSWSCITVNTWVVDV